MSETETLDKLSDAELLRLSVAGQEDAFVALYGRLKQGIFRYAFYMTGSRTSAEEVTQEVFVALLREGDAYRGDRGDVAGFAFGIARNFIRRIGRRERPYLPLPEEESGRIAAQFATLADSLPGQVIRSEHIRHVQVAVAALPDHYRQVVVLCDLCELSYLEAADRLGCAVGTIRSRLNRAHALLARKLKPLRTSEPELGSTGTEGCLI